MILPLLTRYADILRYDRDRGSLAALDWRGYPAQREFVEYTSAEPIAAAIAQGAAGHGRAAAYLAVYGLALAARAWAGRPAETQRAAIIQAGEWLRRARPFDTRLAQMIDQGLACADAATLAGDNAEITLLEYVEREINRADRVAERCGRIASGLLDQQDHVLTYGFAGPALNWLLALALGEESKQPRLTVATPFAQPDSARLAAALAIEVGVPATQRSDATVDLSFVEQSYSIIFIGADRIATDGGIAGPAGLAAYVTLARQHGIPCYVLGYDGPDPSCQTTLELSASIAADPAGNSDVVAPEQISAIVTSRGIYRPEMVVHYLGDGDAPVDVIRLHSS